MCSSTSRIFYSRTDSVNLLDQAFSSSLEYKCHCFRTNRKILRNLDTSILSHFVPLSHSVSVLLNSSTSSIHLKHSHHSFSLPLQVLVGSVAGSLGEHKQRHFIPVHLSKAGAPECLSLVRRPSIRVSCVLSARPALAVASESLL